jgi:AmmeMemoRadiSam system protein A
MANQQPSVEGGERRSRRAVGAAVLLSVLGVVAWLFGRSVRPRAEAEPGAGPEPLASTQTAYTTEDRRALLGLARRSLEMVVREGRVPSVPPGMPAHLTEQKGCFVTLTKGGQLRGCIGHIFPEEPLAEAVIHNAQSAATRDSRFSPVTTDELAGIEVEVSVLSVPRPMEFSSPEDLVKKLRPHQDGVVLSVGSRRATFLPQVWEQLPTGEAFLDHLAAKAGLSPAAWRQPGTRIMTYHVEAFHESDLARADSG